MATVQDWPGFFQSFGAWLFNPLDWTPPAIPGQNPAAQNPSLPQLIQKPPELITVLSNSPADTAIQTVEAAPKVALSVGLGIGAAAVVLALFSGRGR